ncbi:MAG: tRNA (adenosine(37)-N6)-threonylcarbamoyltransferase complex dimerization subunit type 1 TsaB [Holosporaceae bacterium]|jgi:tRNA threonylcarbamoyl adenosine modification protein YeaZ|nr:tRNA (adenosine(37)-N6)-threonylcarbamoyltransferase complex dimerization subunit type 1 TsaB [Holosporaceae bacterium]
MKNVIAITACLKRCSVAILYENNIYEIDEDMDAPTNLVWLAENLIKSNNINLKKVNGIITASGPGSFTGIRTAQSFAKGLALSLKIPAASVDYFDVIKKLYMRRNNINVAETMVAVIKSEKGQVYYKIYDQNLDIGVSAYDALSKILNNNIILVGDAVEEVSYCSDSKIVNVYKVTDFKQAKYLLDFIDNITVESKIFPLYVNAQKKC